MKLTDLFIRRPVIAIVVNLVIVIAGLQAIRSLNARQYPRSENAQIVVTTTYVGANAELVRGFITTPIERVMAAADGIDYIESESKQNLSTIRARLRLNYEATRALSEIGSKIDQVRAQSATTTRARLGASVQTGATRLMPYVRLERQALDGAGSSTEPFVGVSAFVLPQPRWGPVLGPAFFRGALESRAWGGGSAPRITTASLFASRPLWSGVSLETGLVWQRGSRGPLIQVTFPMDSLI